MTLILLYVAGNAIASVSNDPLLLNERQPPSDICGDAELKACVAGVDWFYAIGLLQQKTGCLVLFPDYFYFEISSPRCSFGLPLLWVSGGDFEICPV